MDTKTNFCFDEVVVDVALVFKFKGAYNYLMLWFSKILPNFSKLELNGGILLKIFCRGRFSCHWFRSRRICCCYKGGPVGDENHLC